MSHNILFSMDRNMQLAGAALLIAGACGFTALSLPLLGLSTQTSAIYMIAVSCFRLFAGFAAGAFIGPEFKTRITALFPLVTFGLLGFFIPGQVVLGLLAGYFSTNKCLNIGGTPNERKDFGTFKPENDSKTGLADLVEVPSVTKKLKETAAIVFALQEGNNPYELEPPKGILMYGPPGTGKTSLTRGFAHELGATVFVVLAGQVLGKALGETEEKINQLFAAAISARTRDPKKPVIIFMDEIHALGKSDDEQLITGRVAIPTLLQHIDGYNKLPEGILFVAATNHIDKVDAALLDRLELIETKLPNVDQREELFKRYISDNVNREEAFDFRELAEKTRQYSCRKVCQLINDAKKRAHLDHERTPKQLLRSDFSVLDSQ